MYVHAKLFEEGCGCSDCVTTQKAMSADVNVKEVLWSIRRTAVVFAWEKKN
jgi:hypothetical protein